MPLSILSDQSPVEVGDGEGVGIGEREGAGVVVEGGRVGTGAEDRGAKAGVKKIADAVSNSSMA